MNFEKSNILRVKAKSLIPGGAHTYSKGDDVFPVKSPFAIKKGYGAKVEDVDGNEFIDWGMGLTSVILGHAYEPIVNAVKDELSNGCNFIRPSFIEAELAEQFIEQIPSAEMVKFGKNGSNATTAAVKLARAYTGKDIILRCGTQPFFSIDDWFIGSTVMNAGIPKSIQELTKQFKYNDIQDLTSKIDEYYNQIACVIMEPASTEEPNEGYLKSVKEICNKNGIVLIFDEVVSGFRFHPKGAQYLYGVTPDLSCFGKAMANGFSISALAGKKEIMSLGGLEHDKERIFLLSTTYGGETHHLRAAQKTIEILNANDYAVTKHIWNVGKRLKEAYNKEAKLLGISKYTSIQGIDCRPFLVFTDENGKNNFLFRTLFMEQMIKNGILVQSFNPSYSHTDNEIVSTIRAFKITLKYLKNIILDDAKYIMDSYNVKSVFRKYN